MEINETVHRLQYSLARDDSGSYRLPCRKALLKVKLRVSSIPFQFTARDQVRFWVGQDGLTIEKLKTGTVLRRFSWNEIESVTAGEPETESGQLFQG